MLKRKAQGLAAQAMEKQAAETHAVETQVLEMAAVDRLVAARRGFEEKVFDMPAFFLREAGSGWQVCITWPDGEEGPAIDFVTRDEAYIWIARDARDWLSRLQALSGSPG